MANMNVYTAATAVLAKFDKKRGSVKSLVYGSDYKNLRQLYALVCESLKYQAILQRIFKECGSLQAEEVLKKNSHLATVLLYDHLVGKGLGHAGKIRSCIVKHKREIKAVCSSLLEEKGAASLSDLLSSQCLALNKLPIPRYARVNQLKTTVEDVVAAFTADQWLWRGPLTLTAFREAVESLGRDGFGLDPLLPDLLVFPPGTDLHDHPLVSAGNIILQDRASCFPAHVLNPPAGAVVLDCCAAPGNKTSHVASLLGNSGKILAYERDAKRASLLKRQLGKAGVTNATVAHQDFLSVDPNDPAFADVQYILVDPSCSGSGMLSRMDHVSTDSPAESAQRLLSLQRFQVSILSHALLFPSARRVVYSTCSLHQEENEAVVTQVIQQVRGEFRVVSVFPEFLHRGQGSSHAAQCCLRMSPKEDLTNGFFVACFQRRGEGGGDSESDGEEGEGESEDEGGRDSEEGRGESEGEEREKGESEDEGEEEEGEGDSEDEEGGEESEDEVMEEGESEDEERGEGGGEDEGESEREESEEGGESEDEGESGEGGESDEGGESEDEEEGEEAEEGEGGENEEGEEEDEEEEEDREEDDGEEEDEDEAGFRGFKVIDEEDEEEAEESEDGGAFGEVEIDSENETEKPKVLDLSSKKKNKKQKKKRTGEQTGVVGGEKTAEEREDSTATREVDSLSGGRKKRRKRKRAVEKEVCDDPADDAYEVEDLSYLLVAHYAGWNEEPSESVDPSESKGKKKKQKKIKLAVEKTDGNVSAESLTNISQSQGKSPDECSTSKNKTKNKNKKRKLAVEDDGSGSADNVTHKPHSQGQNSNESTAGNKKRRKRKKKPVLVNSVSTMKSVKLSLL